MVALMDVGHCDHRRQTVNATQLVTMNSSGVEEKCTLKSQLDALFDNNPRDDGETRQSLNAAIAILQEKLKALPSPEPRLVEDNHLDEEHDTKPATPFLVKSQTESLFTLPFSEPLAKTRKFEREWAVLPNAVANIRTENIDGDELLEGINMVFETDFKHTRSVEICLSLLVDDGLDFGEIYGYLRPWMEDVSTERDLMGIIATLQKRREEDVELRSAAIVGTRIINPKVPPRRVWDLYSNRVLPYYVLRPSLDLYEVPRLPYSMWAVSHSWVDLPHRQYVVTPINGRSWPVPIPLGTTLDDIRNELLILGAEYVWLDVLCLRQADQRRTGAEEVRKREWKLDVPTIGHIYTESLHRTIVVYFNGLGLPFRDEPVDPNDRFHWCNRAWTLQECPTSYILPGGLEKKMDRVKVQRGSSCASAWSENPDFIRRFDNSLLLPKLWDLDVGELATLFEMRIFHPLTLQMVVERLSGRFSSIPLDLISAIAYPLGCPILPIYDPDERVEVAWHLLVQCLPDMKRTHLLFTDYDPADISISWIPPWEQVESGAGLREIEEHVDEEEQLTYMEGSSPNLGHRQGLDAYYHRAFVITNCHITFDRALDGELKCVVRVPISNRTYHRFRRHRVSEWGSLLPRPLSRVTVGHACEFQGLIRPNFVSHHSLEGLAPNIGAGDGKHMKRPKRGGFADVYLEKYEK